MRSNYGVATLLATLAPLGSCEPGVDMMGKLWHPDRGCYTLEVADHRPHDCINDTDVAAIDPNGQCWSFPCPREDLPEGWRPGDPEGACTFELFEVAERCPDDL